MAKDIREVLSRYVPQTVLDQAVEEIRDTDISPEWWRQQAAELGGAAKERDELKRRLDSIESAPRRKEALARVGIDYDAVPKYGQKALDALPMEHLADLNKVAQYVSEQGFEANLQTDEAPREVSGAEAITNFMTQAGTGAPVRTGQAASDAAFYADLEKVPDGDKEGIRAVLAAHGRLENQT